MGWRFCWLPLYIISIYAMLMAEPPLGTKDWASFCLKQRSLNHLRVDFMCMSKYACYLQRPQCAGTPLNIMHRGWPIWVEHNLSSGSGSHIINTAALLRWIYSPRAQGCTSKCSTGANMECLDELWGKVATSTIFSLYSHFTAAFIEFDWWIPQFLIPFNDLQSNISDGVLMFDCIYT